VKKIFSSIYKNIKHFRNFLLYRKSLKMPVLQGLDHNQISFFSLEDSIAADNEVRFIDAFVDKLDLERLEIKSLCQT